MVCRCSGAPGLRGAGRLDETEDAIATTLETIGAHIDDLTANVDKLLVQERALVKPRRWAARATKRQRNELVDRVDQFNSDYSLLAPACLKRMNPGHYRTTNCRNQHQPERSAATPTDLSPTVDVVTW